MYIILPDGNKEKTSNALAHYVNCLKNFHEAVEAEVELHKAEDRDIFTTMLKIEIHTRNYSRSLTDGMCKNCREG